MSFSSVEDLSEAGRSAQRGQDVRSASRERRLNHIRTTLSILQQLAAKVDLASLTPGRRFLRRCLGRSFRVVITDGRILIGIFNCTDKDANIVLTMCAEYLTEDGEPRILGNVMIPGKHIVKLDVERHSSDDEDFEDDDETTLEKRDETPAEKQNETAAEKQNETAAEKQDETASEKQDETAAEKLSETTRDNPVEKTEERRAEDPPEEAVTNSEKQQ